MLAERVSEYAPHRSPVGGGDDTHCGTPTRTEDAPELREPLRGIREKLQAELAYDSVKAATPERQHLAVRGHGPKRSIANARARCLEHRRRDVDTNDESRLLDGGHSALCGLAWSRGNIEYTVSGSHLCRVQHGGHEKPRPLPDVLSIRARVDRPAGDGVEARPEFQSHRCPQAVTARPSPPGGLPGRSIRLSDGSL